MYLTKIIQGLVAGVCCGALFVGGRSISVSDHDNLRASGRFACLLECKVNWGQIP